VGAREYINSISGVDAGAVKRDVEAILANDLKVISTKQLRGRIRELIVGHHRFTYFKIETTVFFVRGFRKKSAKTPRNEIDYAEKMYRLLKKTS